MSEPNKLDERLCFCCSGRRYQDCCAPIISGDQVAANAEQLMRSRYTAYVLEDSDYLLASWHPDTRPASLDLGSAKLRWIGLTLRRCQAGNPGDQSGRVEFVAYYDQQGTKGQVHEDSRFVFEKGHWLYLDGNLQASNKVGRNDPCPCGSGKKYKKCCARR